MLMPTRYRTSGTRVAVDTGDAHRNRIGSLVDAGGLKPNIWHRFERLDSAWELVRLGVGDDPGDVAEDESGVVANPGRRARTPLATSEVDAIRTARENGVSVTTLARQYWVHRSTTWEKTRPS